MSRLKSLSNNILSPVSFVCCQLDLFITNLKLTHAFPQFTHDLLKQSIYDTIDQEARKILHKTIGQMLLESGTKSPEFHLIAVDQINIFCNDCSLSQEERPRFAAHQLHAAKIALKESNFEQGNSLLCVVSCGL